MSAALTAQPGLHSTAMAVSMKANVKDKNRKRKKEYHGGRSVCNSECLFYDICNWVPNVLRMRLFGFLHHNAFFLKQSIRVLLEAQFISQDSVTFPLFNIAIAINMGAFPSLKDAL